MIVAVGTDAFEARIPKDGQTRERVLLVFAVGEINLIVGVNKIDSNE